MFSYLISHPSHNFNNELLSQLKNQNLKQPEHVLEQLLVPRIVLFGMSANPPTLAHRQIVQYLASMSPAIFDEIW